jgi:hypothetical protein
MILLIGTRNCTGAANGGVCLGSSLDIQLCDTNVSCSGMLAIYLFSHVSTFILISRISL